MTSAERLVVYHTSDVHDRRGWGRKLAALIEPGALLVDCGDALRGSSTVYLRREPVMDEFALAPYGVQAVGNREFHYLHRCMLARSKAMGIPWVCSNLIDLRPRTPAFARERIVGVAGLRVRVLGLLVPQYRTGSGWEAIFGWRFLAPAAALGELLERPSEPADVTIVLSHLGLAADRAIARAFPSLGAIVGGHSHDTLHEPDVASGVPIVHAGAFARTAGRLELAVEDGRARVASYRLLPLLQESPAP
jgi:2',3'-cyclic-nucleotide 2'-phosphodiesterase (5'-nucleotidase family)